MAGWSAAPVITGLAIGVAFVLLFSFLLMPVDSHGRVVFSGLMNENGTHQIYIVNTDGTGLTRLTEKDDWWYFVPASSPNGSKIAYTAQNSFHHPYSLPRDKQLENLYVMNADGTSKTLLVNSSAGSIGRHVWSPDSTKIAYEFSNDLFIINADGTDGIQLTNDGGQAHDLKPVWSSNEKIRFVSVAFNGTEPLEASWKEVNVDGTNLKTLFDYDHDIEGFHEWSPDLSKISFLRVNDEFSASLYIMNADGSNQTRLADSPPLSFRDRVWSPDSRKIVFQNWDDHQIYTIDAASGFFSNLSNDETSGSHPMWSPDGRQIAFIRGFDDGYAAISVMNADGTDQRQVVRIVHSVVNVPMDWINE